MLRIDAQWTNGYFRTWLAKSLEPDLSLISQGVPNTELVYLFVVTVRKVAVKHKDLFRSHDEPDRQDIVWRVKEQVNTITPGDEKYLACLSILEGAMEELKDLLTKNEREKLEKKKRTAIDLDQRRNNPAHQSPPKANISFTVIFMGNPGDPKRKPHVLRRRRE
ncbi:hypothetical protein FRC19_008538 [Serendipita sp. 401]|nr:hypothetical protein FRC19_008538 [Serendipita sp. 401]